MTCRSSDEENYFKDIRAAEAIIIDMVEYHSNAPWIVTYAAVKLPFNKWSIPFRVADQRDEVPQ